MDEKEAPAAAAEGQSKAPAKSKKALRRTPTLGGRPSIYTQRTAQRICELVAQGKTARAISKLPGMPSRSQLFYWLHEREDFARAYALAKQCYAEDIFDENMQIANDAARKIEKIKDPASGANVLRAAKLRIDTSFTTAGLLAPRKYGPQAVAPLLPQALPPEDDDEITTSPASDQPKDAEPIPLEHHPLYTQLKAWERAAKGGREPK